MRSTLEDFGWPELECPNLAAAVFDATFGRLQEEGTRYCFDGIALQPDCSVALFAAYSAAYFYVSTALRVLKLSYTSTSTSTVWSNGKKLIPNTSAADHGLL